MKRMRIVLAVMVAIEVALAAIGVMLWGQVRDLRSQLDELNSEEPFLAYTEVGAPAGVYPISCETTDFESLEALAEFVVDMYDHQQELERAMDYDAEHYPGTVGPSAHEVIDGAAPGEFGGGRKP